MSAWARVHARARMHACIQARAWALCGCRSMHVCAYTRAHMRMVANVSRPPLKNTSASKCFPKQFREALCKHGRIPNILDRLSGVYCGRLTRYAMLPGCVCSCLLSVATI